MIDVIDIEEAARLLDEGEVVAVPTDTVYGVAASLSHPSAIATLFALKRRPQSVALPVLVDSVSQIERLGVSWPPLAHRFARELWPGALTIVVDVPETLARRVGSASDTVGFRIPDDQELRSILAKSGPLCVTSANGHGEPPCESALQVQQIFSGDLALSGVVDGGIRSSTVSTVVRIMGDKFEILRSGAVGPEELRAALDE